MKLGYARVSTPSQDLAGQRARLQAAGAARLFEDVASGRASGRRSSGGAGARRSSGGAVERPGLEALLAQLREGDVVCVVRLDRLGRSLGELLALVERVRAAGAALESLEERIDTGSAAGALVLHVFAALAEFERSLIAERTRDGIAAARARGRRPGRPPADAETLRAALTLVAAGESPTRAARQAGIGRSTLYRALKAGQGA